MYLSEARSFDKGIEFYGRDIVIVAMRQEGQVIISKSEISKLRDKKPRKMSMGLLLFSIVGTLIFKYLSFIENSKFQILGIVALIWLGIICHYFFKSRNTCIAKYHGAEHKVLNYIDKYSKMPEKCEELMSVSSISYRCGSTILAAIMILLTLSIIGFLYIPILAFKIVWIAISIFITLYLWTNDKCNFLQKFVIKEPTYDEIEVAFLGAKEYLKTK